MIDKQALTVPGTAAGLACRDALALVAHDLRTSLTVIHGFARTIAQQDGSLGDVQHRTAVDAIERHARSLIDFSRDIIEILQAEDGALRLARTPVDLGESAARALDDIRPDFPSHRFALDVERTHLGVCADARRVGQVLANLIGNAAKHSPPGTMIAVAAGRGPDYVSVTVTDNGPPLPEHVAADPFTRIGSHPERGSGSGIGLYLCRLLIESMGGRIWAENRPGAVAFGFLLPVAG